MDTNNENAIDGDWHPEWRKTDGKEYFYNTDNMEKTSPILRVANFYFHHIDLIPKIFVNKILAGYSDFILFWLILFFMIAEAYGFILEKYVKSEWCSSFYMLFLTFIVILSLFIFLRGYHAFYIAFEKLLLIQIVPVLFLFNKNFFKAPAIFNIYAINFFLITIIFLGEPRYIGVMNFVFILFFIRYSLEFILRFSKWIEKN